MSAFGARARAAAAWLAAEQQAPASRAKRCGARRPQINRGGDSKAPRGAQGHARDRGRGGRGDVRGGGGARGEEGGGREDEGGAGGERGGGRAAAPLEERRPRRGRARSTRPTARARASWTASPRAKPSSAQSTRAATKAVERTMAFNEEQNALTGRGARGSPRRRRGGAAYGARALEARGSARREAAARAFHEQDRRGERTCRRVRRRRANAAQEAEARRMKKFHDEREPMLAAREAAARERRAAATEAQLATLEGRSSRSRVARESDAEREEDAKYAEEMGAPRPEAQRASGGAAGGGAARARGGEPTRPRAADCGEDQAARRGPRSDDVMDEQERLFNAAIGPGTTRVVVGGRTSEGGAKSVKWKRREVGGVGSTRSRASGALEPPRYTAASARVAIDSHSSGDENKTPASPPARASPSSLLPQQPVLVPGLEPGEDARVREHPVFREVRDERREAHEVFDVQPVVLVLEDDGGASR